MGPYCHLSSHPHPLSHFLATLSRIVGLAHSPFPRALCPILPPGFPVFPPHPLVFSSPPAMGWVWPTAPLLFSLSVQFRLTPLLSGGGRRGDPSRRGSELCPCLWPERLPAVLWGPGGQNVLPLGAPRRAPSFPLEPLKGGVVKPGTRCVPGGCFVS